MQPQLTPYEKKRERERQRQQFIVWRSPRDATVMMYADPVTRAATCRYCCRPILPGMGRLRLRVRLSTRMVTASSGSFGSEDYHFHASCLARAADWSDDWNPRRCGHCYMEVQPGNFAELQVSQPWWARLPLCETCAASGDFARCGRCRIFQYHDRTTEMLPSSDHAWHGQTNALMASRPVCLICAARMDDPAEPPETLWAVQKRAREERRITRKIERWLDQVREKGLW